MCSLYLIYSLKETPMPRFSLQIHPDIGYPGSHIFGKSGGA